DAPAVRFNLGLALYKSARTADAAAEFEKVLAKQPGNGAATLLLAECRLAMGEDEKVVDSLSPLEAKYGDDHAFAYLLGTALLRRGERERGQALIDRLFKGGDAADELAQAVKLGPQLPGAHGLLGRALLRAGSRDAAVQAFRDELAINPND